MASPHSYKALTLGMAIVTGSATLLFGAIRLRTSVDLPFDRSHAVTVQTPEEADAQRTALLKHSDTDGDGLSDYDELYVFHTSPFLASSSSDGIGDGVKIARGEDPNCPEGKTCTEPTATDQTAAAAPTPDASAAAQVAATDTSAPPSIAINAGGAADAAAAATSTAPQTGASTTLDASGQAAAPPATNAPPTAADIAKVKALTPAQIRDFLKSQGMPADQIAKISDADLQKLLLDTLNEVAPSQPSAK